MGATTRTETDRIIEITERYGASNYSPLPVVLAKGEGVWVEDVDGKRYMDMLAAYSALNQGHRHPRLLAAMQAQLERCTLTSRAFHNDQLGPFVQELAELCGMEKVLPMNSGAEAVETAIKAARKWGYTVKGVAEDRAEIICCANNFHGRTITVVSFSTDAQYRAGFGPLTPGFKIVPFGDARAVRDAITPNTVAFLAEPIQAEGGVIVPPDGYLAEVGKVLKENRVLYILDEIQTGLGRCGKLFAHQWENARPDLLILGKALSGGFYPVSAVVGSSEVLGVFQPGDHGSTFGGNPLGVAVAREAMKVIVEEKLPERAHELGEYFRRELAAMKSPHVKEIRGRGLLTGVEVTKEAGTAYPFCKKLMEKGILCKDTHTTAIRFAPPLVITREELDWALERIADVLR
jgi:ornithine--oxo-acid transaminase